MINTTSLTVKQAELVKKMRAYFKGKNVVTRDEMVKFMQTLEPPQKYAPEFIVKNEALKAKDKEGAIVRGKYRLPAAVASAESRAKEKEKAKAKTTKSTKTAKPVETATIKRVGKKTPKLDQAAHDRKLALETAADAVAEMENSPETETAEMTMNAGTAAE